jgi:hypothetical protein
MVETDIVILLLNKLYNNIEVFYNFLKHIITIYIPNYYIEYF